MIIKIVGFKVNVDRSTCYYKVDCPEVFRIPEDKQSELALELKLGHYMRLALEKSDFVSVRK